jgi:FkbM family methyltransferase
MYPVNNFTVIESIWGRFIVPRHDAIQAEALIRTGRTHIEGELTTILGLVNTLPADCVVVDAGSNIGLVSIPIAQTIKARGGAVHAFEVQRQLCYAISGAAVLNDLGNLIVHHSALGATAGRLKNPADQADRYGEDVDFGTYSLLNNQTGDAYVDVRTIDDLGLPRLDFLKIDVEGMDVDVLEGARRMIQAHLPYAWVEYGTPVPGRQSGNQEQDVLDTIENIKGQFSGLEYQFYRMDPLNLLCLPVDKARAHDIVVSVPAI